MHLNKKPLAILDPRTDSRFKGVEWDDSIRSLLCVPMMVKSALIGVLTVYNKREGTAFTDEDQRLLAIIAGQSAQVVENARLYEEEQALHRMKEEVRLAATIQMDLLPKTAPAVSRGTTSRAGASPPSSSGETISISSPSTPHVWPSAWPTSPARGSRRRS